MCAAGGFKLTKFVSNDQQVIDSISLDNKAENKVSIDLSQSVSVQRALAVHWCVASDCLKFRIVLQDKPLTRSLTLHVGEQNLMSSYCIRNLQLANVTGTVDLKILVNTRLRFDKYVCSIVYKAHQRAVLIKRCFRTKNANVLMKTFTVYVRPLLEYCLPVWNFQYVCHIFNIESVQRRFTKHLTGLKNNTYITKLSKLNIDSLELRRLKYNLTLVYCIVHGLTILDCS